MPNGHFFRYHRIDTLLIALLGTPLTLAWPNRSMVLHSGCRDSFWNTQHFAHLVTFKICSIDKISAVNKLNPCFRHNFCNLIGNATRLHPTMIALATFKRQCVSQNHPQWTWGDCLVKSPQSRSDLLKQPTRVPFLNISTAFLLFFYLQPNHLRSLHYLPRLWLPDQLVTLTLLIILFVSLLPLSFKLVSDLCLDRYVKSMAPCMSDD